MGTATAGLATGGHDPDTGKTEEYNGTAWTEVADMSESKHSFGTLGIQTAALSIGGNTPPITGAVEIYDGSTWSSTTNQLVDRKNNRSCGTTTAGLDFAGSEGGAEVTNCEEYTGVLVEAQTVTSS